MCGSSDEPVIDLVCNKCGKKVWMADWEGRRKHDKECHGKLE